MCYDVSFTVDIKQISDYFPDLVWDDQIKMNFMESAHIQGHSYSDHPILYKPKDETDTHLKLMEWGIIPHYITEEEKFIKQRATMLNIRSERVLDDPSSYWYKIRNKRCLVPVTGFYEHRGIDGWKKKVPYYVQLKNQKTFFLPGLFAAANLVTKETGEVHQQYTFGVITREANSIMKQIHNCGDNAGRMPLMLPFELSQAWLNTDLPEKDYREILNFDMPADKLDFKTVYTIRTQKPRPDLQEKTAEYEWPKLPPLTVV